MVRLRARAQHRLLGLDEVADLGLRAQHRSRPQPCVRPDLGPRPDARALQVAERADRRTVRHRDARAEDDVRLHRHVAAQHRVVREPHRLGRDQRRAVGHRLRPPPRLPRRLDRGELGTAVDARHLVRPRLDHRRRPPRRARQHDDVGQIVFARRIAVRHLRQQPPQILAAHRHQPGIAKGYGALFIARILVLDHRLDAPVGRQHAAVRARVRGAEAEHDARRRVALVQPRDQTPHRLRPDQRHVAVEDQHVALETGERVPCLQHRVPGAQLLGLQRGGRAERRHRRLHLLGQRTRHHHDPLRAQFPHRREQVEQHRPPGERV